MNMDQRSQERLNEILSKDKSILTEEDIAFLRARRSYLTESQTQEYKAQLVVQVINQTSNKETENKTYAKQSK